MGRNKVTDQTRDGKQESVSCGTSGGTRAFLNKKTSVVGQSANIWSCEK